MVLNYPIVSESTNPIGRNDANLLYHFLNLIALLDSGRQDAIDNFARKMFHVKHDYKGYGISACPITFYTPS